MVLFFFPPLPSTSPFPSNISGMKFSKNYCAKIEVLLMDNWTYMELMQHVRLGLMLCKNNFAGIIYYKGVGGS